MEATLIILVDVGLEQLYQGSVVLFIITGTRERKLALRKGKQ